MKFTLLALALATVRLHGQAASADLKFDAASIKPCQAAKVPIGLGRGTGGGTTFRVSPGRLTIHCASVLNLVYFAYVRSGSDPLVHDTTPPIRASDVVRGLPSWASSIRDTIEAETSNPAANGPDDGRSPAYKIMMGPMLRSLLDERFHLKIHRETEQVPMYALTVAKNGLKIKPAQKGSCIEPDPALPEPPWPPAPNQKPTCHSISNGKNNRNGANWSFDYVGVGFDQLAAQLAANLDRYVVDKTDATELFTFHLEFERDENAPGPALPSGLLPANEHDVLPAGPSIFSALEQLGLKLEPIKGAHGFIAVDDVQRPSEN